MHGDNISKFFFVQIVFFVIFISCGGIAEAQFLRNLLQDNAESTDWNLRDDRPIEELDEELSFEEIVCRDRKKFPQIAFEKKLSSYFDCKKNLDRIQDSSYIDLTYRIRWDSDRLDLYLPGIREIYICDGSKLTKYEHDERKDPDWWMIARSSPEAVNCLTDEILIETLD
jgi:hypothetical protein